MDVGIVSRPAPEAHSRRDNLVGAVIIALAASFPQIVRRRPARRQTPPVRRLDHGRGLLHTRSG